VHILLITQYDRPVITPNVIRWRHLLEHWLDEGHSVTLLTTRRSNLPIKEEQNQLTIYRTGYASLLDWIYHFRPGGHRRAEAGLESRTKGSQFRRISEKGITLFWRSWYWPDGAMLWHIAGRKLIKKMNFTNSPDIIISVGLPFSAHLLGRVAKKKWPTANWIMDIADPFALSDQFWVNNANLWGERNRQVEKNMILDADKIVLTHEASLEAHLNFYREINVALSEKSVIIPPILTRKMANDGASLVAKNSFIKIGYFGSFYKQVREPDQMITFINKIKNNAPAIHSILSFMLAGTIPVDLEKNINALFDAFVQSDYLGLLPHEAVSDVMDSMDFLLHLGNTTTYHLPSKAPDYLATGKPIINFIQNEQDSFKSFAKDYPLLLNITLRPNGPSPEDIDAFIHFIYTNKDKRVDPAFLERLLTPCTIPQVAKAYLAGLK
jgi:hypothetical protein